MMLVLSSMSVSAQIVHARERVRGLSGGYARDLSGVEVCSKCVDDCPADMLGTIVGGLGPPVRK